MSDVKIIDAHAHYGRPGAFLAPETTADHLLAVMDPLNVSHAICTDHLSLSEGCARGLPALRDAYERSGGRLCYLAVFHPNRSEECLSILRQAIQWPGFVGLKIHPSFHRVPAEDKRYERAWRFAAEHDLPILTHSWSVSAHNPVQYLSTPGRFEGYVKKFPTVRFVLGHAGGRGDGRHEAVRMASEYPNVYVDFAGDIFCHRLIETLVAVIPTDRILFGSDFPWFDPRANLTRVLLADIDESIKMKVLRDNALHVYRIQGLCT